MRYFEFNKTDYYALIAVKESKVDDMLRAMKLYVEHVAYDSLDELRLTNGGHPTEITKEQALLKFLLCKSNGEMLVKDTIALFDDCIDSILLIDSSLC